MTAAEAPPNLELEPASPAVKCYQRQKLIALTVATIFGLSFLGLMAFYFGPALGTWIAGWVGDADWLRLLVMAACLAIGSEILTLPIAFWSGFLVEHREQL